MRSSFHLLLNCVSEEIPKLMERYRRTAEFDSKVLLRIFRNSSICYFLYVIEIVEINIIFCECKIYGTFLTNASNLYIVCSILETVACLLENRSITNS